MWYITYVKYTLKCDVSGQCSAMFNNNSSEEIRTHQNLDLSQISSTKMCLYNVSMIILYT